MASPKKSTSTRIQRKIACVTGASGFVGSRLINSLLSQNFIVKVLTRKKDTTFPDGVEIFYGDLCYPDSNLKNFLIGCDIIFHCAGETRNVSQMHLVNIEGTRRLLKAVYDQYLISQKKIHWVQLSSIGIYEVSLSDLGKLELIDELSKVNANNEYELTKAESDELILGDSRSFMTFSILRPSAIVGFGMTSSSFVEMLRIIKRGYFFYIGSKESISTYIHVVDVVDALIECATNKKAQNQIFNLSNDCNLSDIVNSVSIFSGFKPKFLCLPEKPLRLLVWFMSKFIRLPLTQSRIDALVSRTTYPHTKIKDILGFSPKISIPEFAVEYLESIDD